MRRAAHPNVGAHCLRFLDAPPHLDRTDCREPLFRRAPPLRCPPARPCLQFSNKGGGITGALRHRNLKQKVENLNLNGRQLQRSGVSQTKQVAAATSCIPHRVAEMERCPKVSRGVSETLRHLRSRKRCFAHSPLVPCSVLSWSSMATAQPSHSITAPSAPAEPSSVQRAPGHCGCVLFRAHGLEP